MPHTELEIEGTAAVLEGFQDGFHRDVHQQEREYARTQGFRD